MAKERKTPGALHTFLVMLRASHSLSRYLLPPILKAELGDSDFRVLHVLVENGPTPVNVIGPKVHLNPGSISVAVDRLFKKGLVSRVEAASDRRVRTVSITERGRELFAPLLSQQSALVELAFQDVSPEERIKLEDLLKRIGKRAEALAGTSIEGTSK
jgi:MarR family 2-MHQ and catechol resistance regulon transcriptional repressor